ncbi:hypothetical protein SK128_009185 [Halocaridina rubra]|uniref:Uncharacterized protein n=1 Tax=Halocaridina rubra TaxID=373956 RepID=A0AAN8X9N0_HALRR
MENALMLPLMDARSEIGIFVHLNFFFFVFYLNFSVCIPHANIGFAIYPVFCGIILLYKLKFKDT